MTPISMSTSYKVLTNTKVKIILDSDNTVFRDYIEKEITTEADLN